MMQTMALHAGAMEALERARRDVPAVVRAFLRVTDISQETVGAGIGLSQRQISRRLSVPGALSQEEVAALAAYFGVPVATMYKPVRDAVADLVAVWEPATLPTETRSGSSVGRARA